MPDPHLQRALGTVIGSAVGDALGTPFEFGPEGAFSARFPEPGHDGEMCGGDGWELGEATDDTQMAVLVGESLLECGGLELPDMFRRFQRWAAADPKGIGLQTEAVLGSGDPWDRTAALHFQVSQRAAGNGALMLVRVALTGENPLTAVTDTLAAATSTSSPPTGTPTRRPSSTVPYGHAWAPPSGPCAPPPPTRTPYAPPSTSAATRTRWPR